MSSSTCALAVHQELLLFGDVWATQIMPCSSAAERGRVNMKTIYNGRREGGGESREGRGWRQEADCSTCINLCISHLEFSIF